MCSVFVLFGIGLLLGLAASPCINVCRMAADSGLCVGCLRTLDEIAVWGSASDTQRRMILMDVEKRRERFPS